MKIPKIRSDEAVRTVSAHFNKTTTEKHYRNEIAFVFHNHREIMDAMETGRAVDLATLPKHPRTSVLIVGSGPTLDEAMPFMKDWKGHIICSTSQATTLLAWGREPEHIVALDPDCNSGELIADTWEGRKSILHLHPGVMPDLVRWWKGPMALFRKLQPQNPFYAGEQAMGYCPLGSPGPDGRHRLNEEPLGITAQVPMLACAIPAQICIAKHLGYSQMVLVGADFSFPNDQLRFTTQTWEDGQWVENKAGATEDYTEEQNAINPMVETELDGLMTTHMQIFYSHQAVIACRLVERSIINASHKGLLRMLPYAY